MRRSAKKSRGARAGLGRAVALALAAALAALLLLQFWYFAHVVWWAHVAPATTSFMDARLAELRARNPQARLQHRWVPYSRISPYLARAVIASEDANFTEHDGVDWDAIEKAYEANRRKGRVVRGGSTITMQLAKNLFLSGSRSYVRKAQELAITYMLEAVMGKRRILEVYLNVAEWGEGVFGCEAAARHYYGVSAAQLSPAQAARMAAMLPRPRYYDRNRGSIALARRTSILERWMWDVTPP